MSEELQKEIDRLKAENSKLSRDLAASHDDLKEVRGEARDRRLEGKKLTEALEGLTAERDRYKTAAEADPEGLKSQLAESQGRLREVHHKAAFARVAQGLKVSDPAKVSDLWALSGYQPEGDQADDSKLSEVIATVLKGRAHYLDQPAAGAATQASGGATGATTVQPAAKAGVGAERGQSVTSDSSSTAPGRIPGRL